ncbi:MAG: universal stress protein [Vicinamibacterales bacterium]|nr:universal stress protein [Vicinamibacterales bacterium]
MIKLNNILVATDFSDASESALVYGRTLARTFNARLHVVHVVDNALMFAALDGYTADIATVLSEMADDAEKRILTSLTEDDWREPKTVTDILTGTPADEIARYAKKANIDLIVMGCHGHGFISALLMGRVAEKVVRIAPCPVLTVRTPERDFVKPDTVREAAGVEVTSKA